MPGKEQDDWSRTGTASPARHLTLAMKSGLAYKRRRYEFRASTAKGPYLICANLPDSNPAADDGGT